MARSDVESGSKPAGGHRTIDGDSAPAASTQSRGATSPGVDPRVSLVVTSVERLGPTDLQSAHAGLRARWNRFHRARPFPYPPQVAGKAMALFYVIGGLTTLLAVTLPHPSTLHVPIMLTLGVAAVLVGIAVYGLRQWLANSAYPWLLAAGTVIVTTLTISTGDYAAMVATNLFYLWIVLYAVLFFSRLGVAVHVGLTVAGYWLSSTLYDDSDVDMLTPYEPMILIAIIATTSTVFAMIGKAREAGEIDPLTRVANRRGLDRALDTALEVAVRVDPRLNVAMIDVDHFKTINDTNGHAVGDQVLQDLTAAWEPLLRPEDSIGRRGGDEFLVVLPRCTAVDAAMVFERLRLAAPDNVTCSIGAAQWRAGDSASMLVSRADVALYQAKRRGRDRVTWSSAD